ncbi:unnamed protein product [Hermetia illucens]|uniref:EGF-like domain-containing protein n=1 Tax=Hermetia illucens TaxID=343691 RepID=A0A7R8UQ81_HERIL|nr:unnamed protein product [Hermetia illucens]
MDGCSPPANETLNSVPCSGHGKCESTDNGGFHCSCHSGYTGLYCEHNLNECSPNPCKNGGICLDGDGDFTCECTSGWTGKICTERATQCLPGQCLNGGSCVPINKVSVCRCTSGWGGQFCAEPVDQCQGQPCHNGGTCESGPGWFRCVCARGFSGPDCRINVNECSPQPCLGGATCQDGIGGFTCICPPGRHGMRCEILLSDPGSVCLNTTTLSPYNPLGLPTNEINKTTDSNRSNEENCNACICESGRPKCTNIWCGLPNCLANSTTCESHEVCVPSLQETCLSPPCEPRGDCRSLEPSKRVAPPKLPASPDCWPNQAILNENCARISILLETKHIISGASVEGICLNLRSLLSARLVRHPSSTAQLIILCDIKSGSNDTIEVTMSSSTIEDSQLSLAVRLMGEILSRHSSRNQPEAAALTSVLEVKVETALISNERSGSGLLIGILCGAAIVTFGFATFLILVWKQRISIRSGSGANLSPSMDTSRHDEEKSNNLQNEENLRRYANPLKGSSSSLRGAMELSLTPAPEVSAISTIAGPSALHRSQPLYPPCESDFDKDIENPKVQHNRRSSQILLHKTQNSDMRKNTVGSIESPHKDFGKRSINCQSIPSAIVDSEVLTVHV